MCFACWLPDEGTQHSTLYPQLAVAKSIIFPPASRQKEGEEQHVAAIIGCAWHWHISGVFLASERTFSWPHRDTRNHSCNISLRVIVLWRQSEGTERLNDFFPSAQHDCNGSGNKSQDLPHLPLLPRRLTAGRHWFKGLLPLLLLFRRLNGDTFARKAGNASSWWQWHSQCPS